MSREISEVSIRTPARLHFTLIDLNGELGRIDGGIGIAIDRPNWVITISKEPSWSVPEFINDLIKKLQDSLNLKNSYKFEFESKLPVHVGLGSQTQLSIALAHGLSLLEGQAHTIYELASMVGRGGTSGIGIAAYDNGGFILDGGHTIVEKPDFLPSHFSSAKPAILLHRHEVPSDWYFVVAVPDVGKGKYGAAEVEIFNKYCPLTTEEVEKISRIILMQILPALVENDIEHFGLGLNSIQKVGFKRIENQLQHEHVKSVQEFYMAHGAHGAGLSSFGPATFCVVRTEGCARELASKTKRYLKDNGLTGSVFYTKANNNGAEIKKW